MPISDQIINLIQFLIPQQTEKHPQINTVEYASMAFSLHVFIYKQWNKKISYILPAKSVGSSCSIYDSIDLLEVELYVKI